MSYDLNAEQSIFTSLEADSPVKEVEFKCDDQTINMVVSLLVEECLRETAVELRNIEKKRQTQPGTFCLKSIRKGRK